MSLMSFKGVDFLIPHAAGIREGASGDWNNFTRMIDTEGIPLMVRKNEINDALKIGLMIDECSSEMVSLKLLKIGVPKYFIDADAKLVDRDEIVKKSESGENPFTVISLRCFKENSV